MGYFISKRILEEVPDQPRRILEESLCGQSDGRIGLKKRAHRMYLYPQGQLATRGVVASPTVLVRTERNR